MDAIKGRNPSIALLMASPAPLMGGLTLALPRPTPTAAHQPGNKIDIITPISAVQTPHKLGCGPGWPNSWLNLNQTFPAARLGWRAIVIGVIVQLSLSVDHSDNGRHATSPSSHLLPLAQLNQPNLEAGPTGLLSKPSLRTGHKRLTRWH